MGKFLNKTGYMSIQTPGEKAHVLESDRYEFELYVRVQVALDCPYNLLSLNFLIWKMEINILSSQRCWEDQRQGT